MKKIILLASIAFLSSCCGHDPQPKKQYDFEIVYSNGDTITESFIGVGDNLFSLSNGDLTTRNKTITLVSGVRSYKVTSIRKIGMETLQESEQCTCNIQQITNPE